MQNDGVATHTEHTVLSSAAFADFQGEVCRLLAMRTVGAPYASPCTMAQSRGAASTRIASAPMGSMHGCDMQEVSVYADWQMDKEACAGWRWVGAS